MRTLQVDVAVIGAGTAGLNARREAEKNGARTVMIESGPYGTTCARVGCMPSKLLIAAAEAAHEARHAGRFGVHAKPEIDGRAVLARVRRERDRFVGFVVESSEAVPAEQRLHGRARFLAPTALDVDGVRVEAKATVIATGSAPVIPTELDAVRERVLTNESVFELPDLPESVAVLGTGVIALELGQALHRLGVRTAIFGRSLRVGPASDPQIQASARAVIGAELDLRLGARVHFAPADGGILAEWEAEGGRKGQERFAYVIAAVGRAPNVEDLGLDRAGLALDAAGVPPFDPRTMQCGSAPIFLAGDAAADRPLLHEAADEGKIAGANAARFPDVRAQRRRTPLAIVFTQPQIALVGARYAQLDPDEFEVGEVFYEDQGRARVMGLNAGLVRVYGRRACGTLLGAEMVGPRVEHTAHLLAWAVQQRMTVQQALDCPFYHPVIEEGIQTALRDLSSELRMATARRPSDLECGPGN